MLHPRKSTKSRPSNSSIQIQIKPKCRFRFVPRDAEKIEFLDCVVFGDVACPVKKKVSYTVTQKSSQSLVSFAKEPYKSFWGCRMSSETCHRQSHVTYLWSTVVIHVCLSVTWQTHTSEWPQTEEIGLEIITTATIPTSFHGSPRTFQSSFHGNPQISNQVFAEVNVPVTQSIVQENCTI